MNGVPIDAERLGDERELTQQVTLMGVACVALQDRKFRARAVCVHEDSVPREVAGQGSRRDDYRPEFELWHRSCFRSLC